MSYYAYAPPPRSTTPPLYYHRPAGVAPAYRTLASTTSGVVHTGQPDDSRPVHRASVENGHRQHSVMPTRQSAECHPPLHPQEYEQNCINNNSNNNNDNNDDENTSINANQLARHASMGGYLPTHGSSYPVQPMEQTTAPYTSSHTESNKGVGPASRSSWPRLSYPAAATHDETHSCPSSLARHESKPHAIPSLPCQGNNSNYTNMYDKYTSSSNSNAARMAGNSAGWTGYTAMNTVTAAAAAAAPMTTTTATTAAYTKSSTRINSASALSRPTSAQSSITNTTTTTAAAARMETAHTNTNTSSDAALPNAASMPPYPSASSNFPAFYSAPSHTVGNYTAHTNHNNSNNNNMTASAVTSHPLALCTPSATNIPVPPAPAMTRTSAWSTRPSASRRPEWDSFSARLTQTEEALHTLGTEEAELRIELAELRRVQLNQTDEQLQLSRGWSALLELEERYHTEVAPNRQADISQAELRVLALQSRATDTADYLRQLQQSLQHRAHVRSEHAALLRALSTLTATAADLRRRRGEVIARAERYFELESVRGDGAVRRARELERELRALISARGGRTRAGAVNSPLAQLLALNQPCNNNNNKSHDVSAAAAANRESNEGRSVRFAHDLVSSSGNVCADASAQSNASSSMPRLSDPCHASAEDETADLSSESVSLPHESLVSAVLGGGVDWASASVCLGLGDEDSMEMALHSRNKSNGNQYHNGSAVCDTHRSDGVEGGEGDLCRDTTGSAVGRHLGGPSVSVSLNQTHAEQREALSKRRRVEMVSV